MEKAKDFIRSAWTNFPTGNITRVGVRSAYLIEAKDFKAAFDNYRSKFLAITDDELKKIQWRFN